MTITNLNISEFTLDFDSAKQQLQDHLASKDSWQGFLTTQTGQTLIEFVAAKLAYDGVKLHRYYEDSFASTAVADNAIYAIATMQGIRLTRKLSASLSVSLKAATVATPIPAYSQFTIAGRPYFNREGLTIGTTAGTFTLYEGSVVTRRINGLGSDFQMFISEESGFVVSDEDVRVSINSIPLPKTGDGLWRFKGAPGYRDRTLPDGRLVVEFGSANYGSKPSVTDAIDLLYVITVGSESNSYQTNGKRVAIDAYPDVSGNATQNPIGGADQPSSLLYKNISPSYFGTFGSAVTRGQYLATAAQYPGVIDAKTYAQRELNPTALQWMNVVKVVVLPNTPWSEVQKNNYVEWLQERTMYGVRILLENPVAKATNIEGTIYCYNWANITQCRQDAENALRRLFALRHGILGFDIHVSDIIDAVLESNKGIEYFDLTSPTSNLLVSDQPIGYPGVSLITGTSTLAIGPRLYAVSPILPEGEIAPRNYSSISTTVANNQRVVLTWEKYPGATGYRIWGRSPSELVLLTTLGDVLTYTDDGSQTTTTKPPAGNSIATRYNTLGTTNLTARFSKRGGVSRV